MTRGLPAADTAENLKYFSPIPRRGGGEIHPPRYSPSLVHSLSRYQINKGEYQIKLRSKRGAAARFGGQRDRCNGASNIQRTAISLNTQARARARAACFALIVIKRIAINPGR